MARFSDVMVAEVDDDMSGVPVPSRRSDRVPRPPAHGRLYRRMARGMRLMLDDPDNDAELEPVATAFAVDLSHLISRPFGLRLGRHRPAAGGP